MVQSLYSIVIALFCSFSSLGKDSSTFKNKVLPLLQEYCYDCHGEGAQKGNFAMDELIALGNFSKHSKEWERVWKNVYNRNMPPANVPQPFDPEISAILSWIEEASFEHDPSKYDPGHVVLRRLNRIEYQNTVQDIFKVKIKDMKMLAEKSSLEILKEQNFYLVQENERLRMKISEMEITTQRESELQHKDL